MTEGTLRVQIPGPLLIAACLALASCAGTNEAEIEGALAEARMRMLEVEIVGLIGDATCRDSTECRTIGFGSKPCGGPWRYLVYSASSVDTARLTRLVSEYNEANITMNRGRGIASDCSVEPVPRVTCVDGRCIAVGHN